MILFKPSVQINGLKDAGGVCTFSAGNEVSHEDAGGVCTLSAGNEVSQEDAGGVCTFSARWEGGVLGQQHGLCFPPV